MSGTSLSFWDALVVEAAGRAGATRLVTEDLQGGRRIGGSESRTGFSEESADASTASCARRGGFDARCQRARDPSPGQPP